MSAPGFATWLLKRFRSGDDALLGDLFEELRNGRSAGWYWRQVIRAIFTGCAKDIRKHPLLAMRAIATGWVVLLLIFAFLGDRTADALANWAWNWSRYEDGYIAGIWWPFWITASFVSYAGFGASGWAVARGYGMPLLLAYAGSIMAALAVSAAIIEWLARPIGGPHALFYVISPGLPYVWRSGFILAPLVILLVGLVSSRKVPVTK